MQSTVDATEDSVVADLAVGHVAAMLKHKRTMRLNAKLIQRQILRLRQALMP